MFLESYVQFTTTAGSGAGAAVQVVVQTRSSDAVTLQFVSPSLSSLTLLSGLKNESVLLRVSGSMLAYACSTCTMPTTDTHTDTVLRCSGSGRAPIPCSTTACDTTRVPVVTIVTGNSTVLCKPECVYAASGSAAETSIVCRTDGPVAVGALSVTIGGVKSSAVPYSYEDLLPKPVLEEGITPVNLPSAGGLCVVDGENLGSHGVVVLTDDMGTVTVSPSLYSASRIQVLPRSCIFTLRR